MPYSRVTRTMNGADALAYAMGYGYEHDKSRNRNKFVGAVNMLPEEAMPFKEQMQPYWDRADPRHTTQVNRFIVSFHKSELDPDKESDCYLAMEIGCEIARANAPDCQSAVFVQTDGRGGKVHIHIVTNDVRMSDHKGLDHGAYYHPNFRKLVDKTCEQYFKLASPEAGLAPERVNAQVRGQRIENERIFEANEAEVRQARREGREVDRSKLREYKYIWQDDIRECVKKAAAGAADEEDFAHRLRLAGVELVPEIRKDGTASYRHHATKKQPEYYLYELFDMSGFTDKIPANLRSKSFKLGANYQPDAIAKLFAAPAKEEAKAQVAEPVREAGAVLEEARTGKKPDAVVAQTDRDRDMAELKRTQQRAKKYVSTLLESLMPDANEDAIFEGFLQWRQRRRKEPNGIKPVWKKGDDGKGVLLRTELNRQYLEYVNLVMRDKAERDRVRAVEEKLERIAELDRESEEIKRKAAGDRDVTDG